MLFCTCLWLLYQSEDIDVTEEMRVEFVVLDIMATRSDGTLITDLSLEDFEVREDRKKVKITQFNILDLRGDGSPIVADPSPSTPESDLSVDFQQVIVALDFQYVDNTNPHKAIRQLRAFLEGLPPTRTTFFLFDLEHGAITDEPVKSAHQAIAALDRYKNRYWDSNILIHTSMNPRGSGSGMGYKDTLAELERVFENCGHNARCIQETLESYEDAQKDKSLRTLEQLQKLTNVFFQQGGLKSLYFVSPGFTLQAPYAAQELARSFVTQGNGGNDQTLFVGNHSGYRLDREYQRLIHTCVRNRIAFHTLDVFNVFAANERAFSPQYQKGPSVRTHRIFEQYEADAVGGLEELAKDSGGSFTAF